MDWALVVDLLKGIAWPLVVGGIAWMFRAEVRRVIDRVKKLKAGPAELEMIGPGDVPPPPPQLPPAPDQKALPAPVEDKAPPQLEPPLTVDVSDLVSYEPRGAVINAWGQLEEVMRREAVRLEVLAPNEGAVSPVSVVARLRSAGAMAEEQAALAERLWNIRNQVVSGVIVTGVAAGQYVITAETLMRAIEAYADINRLRRIFSELNVDYTRMEQVREVRVGRLSGGRSADPEAALAIARNRSGTWGARRGGARIQISERDAALLVARGASLVEDVEAPE